MVVFSGHQPNFLPYMGFFYKMYKSDVFVFDDDVQYSSKEWHNCNYLKVQDRKFKTTVPVSYGFGDKINDVEICYSRPWTGKFLSTLEMNYSKCPHFEEVFQMVKLSMEIEYKYLVELNLDLLDEIRRKFGIKTRVYIASVDLPTELKNNDRNIYQAKELNANVYYSGIGGKEYNDEEAYRKNGIKIVYSDYKPVIYKQTGTDFIENLSVLDYIMNEGFKLPEDWRKEI